MSSRTIQRGSRDKRRTAPSCHRPSYFARWILSRFLARPIIVGPSYQRQFVDDRLSSRPDSWDSRSLYRFIFERAQSLLRASIDSDRQRSTSVVVIEHTRDNNSRFGCWSISEINETDLIRLQRENWSTRRYGIRTRRRITWNETYMCTKRKGYNWNSNYTEVYLFRCNYLSWMIVWGKDKK